MPRLLLHVNMTGTSVILFFYVFCTVFTRRADPNWATPDGNIPLVLACCHSDVRVVKALLAGKANVEGNIEDAGPNPLVVTPLMQAAETGSPEVCCFNCASWQP